MSKPAQAHEPDFDNTEQAPSPAEPGSGESAGDTDAAAGSAEDEANDRASTGDDPFTSLQKDRDEVHARLLRVSADYQNYVRRSGQNISAARDQMLMDMAKALITVMDHFDRALEVDIESTSAQNLLDGMQIVRDELLRALERFGIQRLNVRTGDVFDPTRHEALMRQATEGVETDCVAAQLQPGYTLGDKTVRPAQVTVAE